MVRVTITINGKEYNLKGSDDSQYLKDIAEYVDTKIKEIKIKNSTLSTTDMAVLAALNIADKLNNSDINNKTLSEKTKALEVKIENLEERYNKTFDELEKLKEEHQNLINQGDKKYQNKITQLEQENEELSAQYAKKNEELRAQYERKNQETSVQYVKKYEEEKNRNNKIINDYEKLKQENEKMSNEYIEIGEKHSNLLDINKNLESENSELKNSFNELKNSIKDKLSDNDKEKSRELTTAKYKIMDLEKKLIDLQIELAKEKKRNNPLMK